MSRETATSVSSQMWSARMLPTDLSSRPPRNPRAAADSVVARVKAERQSNEKIFGLVDGETAASHGGTDALLECRRLMFALPGEPGLDGVFFLSAHEVENLILLYGGIYELIPRMSGWRPRRVRRGAGARKRAETHQAVLRRRPVEIREPPRRGRGRSHDHREGWKVRRQSASTTALLLELKARVKAEGGDWEVYRDEMRRIIKALSCSFAPRPCLPKRGPIISSGSRTARTCCSACVRSINRRPHDALLADALTQPPYSDRFRTELLELTQAA